MTANDRPPPHVERSAQDVANWLATQEPATPLPPDVVAKMSPRERLDYARRFDQSKMPAWKDPRQGAKAS
jgi:hypothetical protein